MSPTTVTCDPMILYSGGRAALFAAVLSHYSVIVIVGTQHRSFGPSTTYSKLGGFLHYSFGWKPSEHESHSAGISVLLSNKSSATGPPSRPSTSPRTSRADARPSGRKVLTACLVPGARRLLPASSYPRRLDRGILGNSKCNPEMRQGRPPRRT